MGVIVVGLSHKTAPVELRERLAIPTQRLAESLNQLKGTGEFKESVILSTCNRFEVYARPANKASAGFTSIRSFLKNLHSHPRLVPALYQYEAQDAIRHLFRVTAGLDSMVVGETEILGQVKSSYLMAQSHQATGKITNVLFQRALYVGKKVRTQTAISEGASSVGSIAVQLAERIFGPLIDHRVLLLGAGKMAEVTARHLLSQKVGEIMILNRTQSKAEELAKLLKGTAGPMEALTNELLRADIVVCSTASERPFIHYDMVQKIMKARKGRSLYFIDIAVPRNVEPSVHELDNVYVYNIDDLSALVQENLSKRKSEVDRAESMVTSLAQEFNDWVEATVHGKEAALRHSFADDPSV